MLSERSTTSSARSASDRDIPSYPSPSSSLAPNDEISRRPRRKNVEFGMSLNDLLPPSIGQRGTIGASRTKNGYLNIAASISDLAR